MYSLIAEAMGGVLRGLRLEFRAEVFGELSEVGPGGSSRFQDGSGDVPEKVLAKV